MLAEMIQNQQGIETIKIDEARDLLAPIYDWFSEGFDTTDLKEAKTLQGCSTLITCSGMRGVC